ncbi:MAG: hypothetical protein ACOYUZ_02030 [Patescibacteria group bacterium]
MDLNKWQVQEVYQIPKHIRARGYLLLDGDFAFIAHDTHDGVDRLCYKGNLGEEHPRIGKLTQAGGRPLYSVQTSSGTFFLRWHGLGDGPLLKSIGNITSLNGEPYYTGLNLNGNGTVVILGEDEKSCFPQVGNLNHIFGKTCYTANIDNQKQAVILDGKIVRVHDDITCFTTAEGIMRYAARDQGDGTYVYCENDKRGPYTGVWHLQNKRGKPLYSYQINRLFFAVYGHVERQCSSFVQHLANIGKEPVFTFKFQQTWHVYQDNRSRRSYDRIFHFLTMDGKTLHDAKINTNAFAVCDGRHLKSYKKILWLGHFLNRPFYGAEINDREQVAVYNEIETPGFDEIIGQECNLAARTICIGARRGRTLYRATFKAS